MSFSFTVLMALSSAIVLLQVVMWYLYAIGKAIWRGRPIRPTPLIVLSGVSVVVLCAGWLLFSLTPDFK